ncbi:MAG: hypothetical protein AAGC63_16095 [Propionicimonas sp.]
MSTQFFRVDDGSALLWVAAFIKGRGLWAWVPNTGAWHHHLELEVDFATDRELTYTPITPEEAGDLARQAPRVDERAGMGEWVVQEFRDQPAGEKLDDAGVGIPAGRKPRPSIDLVARLAKTDLWVVARSYENADGATQAAARQYVSRLKRGSASSALKALGELDARWFERDLKIVVEARRLPDDEKAPDAKYPGEKRSDAKVVDAKQTGTKRSDARPSKAARAGSTLPARPSKAARSTRVR